MMYQEEKDLMGKQFIIQTEQKMGNCKMKVGDKVEVVDYGSGMVSNVVKITNHRLGKYYFTLGTWLFKRITKQI